MREPGAAPVSLEQAREQTVQELCAHFAADRLRVEEFERRLDQSYRATSPEGLRALLQDLPGLGVPDPTTSTAGVPVLSDSVARSGVVVGLFSGPRRRGSWQPPRHLRVIACMGGVELDFRSARLAPGVTRVTAFALMGSVEIIVPPGLAVRTGGFAIMGGFDPHDQIGEAGSDPHSARLEISGFAMMGAVQVHQRLEGESAREARRRLKREHQARRLKRGDRRG